MRKVVCSEYGSPHLLTIVEEADPTPSGDQVVIATAACGIGYIDALLVAGGYQVKIPTPFTPGGEIAGTVIAVGPDARAIRPGDAVMALPGIGGLADRIVLSEGRVRLLPHGMSPATAAAMGLDFATAGYALFDRGSLAAGESLLVLGAAGGVGEAAVKVGKALGATVIGAASSEGKLSRCRAAGADHTINYSEVDLKLAAREICPGGVDVVVDPVGGPVSEPALRATAWNGRFLVVGFASGEIASVPLNLPLLRGCQVVGVDWRVFSARDPEGVSRVFDRLAELYTTGRINPEPTRTYSLDDAPAALAEVLERRRIGKSIVAMDMGST